MNRRAFRGRVRVTFGRSSGVPERLVVPWPSSSHSENAKKISTPARLLSLLFLFFWCVHHHHQQQLHLSHSKWSLPAPFRDHPRGPFPVCSFPHLPSNANPFFISTPQLTGVVISVLLIDGRKKWRKKDLRWPIPNRRPLSVPFRVTPSSLSDASSGPCESAAGGSRERQ